MTKDKVKQRLFDFTRDALGLLNTVEIGKYCEDMAFNCGNCLYYSNGCDITKIRTQLNTIMELSRSKYVVCFQIHEGNHFDTVTKPPIYGPDTKENCEKIAKDLKNVIIFRVNEQ